MAVRIRSLLAAAVLLAALPVAARAEDSPTATVSDTPTVVTTVASPVDLVEQARVLALIERRASKINAPSKSGFIAVYPDGTPLWKARANVPLMPASTMKVVTAAVALHVLGPTWKPVTSVDFDSTTGTLTLVGGGDAVLTSKQLEALAQATIETLTASSALPTRLTIDDSLFPAPVLQPGVTAGQQPREERPVRALVVDRRKSNDSSLDAGKRFREILAAQGVLVPFKGRALTSGTRIASVRGLRLQSALNSMLVYSDNDIAEMTFRLSSLGTGRTASWEDARATAYEALATMGVPTKSLKIIDGSGLSRSNRLTASALAELLSIVEADPRMSILHSLLPVAGIDGTLRKRYASGPAACVQGLLQAKTGSLHDVIALAGYAPTDDGTSRPFAILINGVQNSVVVRNKTRAQIDNLAAAFSGC